ncbi:hypothetical protein SLEP1_g57362 [Rubroshorea leprosula]|uniref:Uncharacterized protein n=1 Tax=Rubroshorea leprosula TaxID=152421 RepID=A0AAV5ML17_9ROSI|nr:hypothetical protein SLEP1_g57362 [Rubroshorea leprosula]
MVRTFTGGRPPRNEMDEQEDAQVSELGLNDFRPMPRNLFVGGAKQDHLSETDDERTPTGYATQPKQLRVSTGTRQRPSRPYNSQHERPERSTEPARTTELEERTRVLEMAMAAVVATRNSLALSNIVVPTRPRGSGKLNNEPSSSKHSEELMRKNADLERDSKFPTWRHDGSGDPDEHLHTYQAIMRIQNANDAMMCKVFPVTLKSTVRRWYHKLPRHSIDLYSQLAKLFSNKFASQREIKCTATELMQVNQKEGESLRDYMQRFNKATLDIDNVPDTICLSALLHGLRRGRFLDDLLENPPRTWNEVNDRSASFILSEDFQSSKRRADDKQSKSQEQPLRREEKKKQKVGEQWGKPTDFPKYANYIPLTLSRSQILAQIQHWVRRPPPPLHDSPRADKSKHCDYHRVWPQYRRLPTLEGRAGGYDQPQGQRYQLDGAQNVYQDSQYPSDQGRAYRGCPFNRRGQGQRAAAQNQKDKKGVGYAGIPPPSEWKNTPITFSPADYKRAERELDIMMPHADPFVVTVHIGNHNVHKVFIDTGSSPDILYWSCFQKMQLNPNSLQKHEGPIYGFDKQPVSVEGVITLPIYVGSEPRFRMASVTFLVVKMESAFNAILGRATLCELKAVISQPHLCMKFPTPQGVGVLKGNQKMARACYQDTFKKVELAAAPSGSENRRPTQLGQQMMSISDIEHRPDGVEQKAEPVEPDVFAWTTDEMPGIPPELTVHKLSTDPTRRPVVQKRCLFGPEKQTAIDEEIQKLLQAGFIRRVEYSKWVSNPVLVKKPNSKWRMCIDFTNLNDACPKDPHPLPNVEKLVERAAGHERMSFLDANSGYHQIGRNIKVYVDDMIVTNVRAGDHIDDMDETFQNLRRAQMKLNPLKCTFAVESGKFLGYVVSKKGIEINPEKVQAVQQMEPPKTIKDVQHLTGRVAALHRFIARLAERCLTFFKALQEPKNFQWTDECQQAFDELKQYLASAPLLSKLVDGECLYLYLGVTEEAVSSVLLREENKNQKPICYVSKVLQGAEQNYSLAEKAAFALKHELSGRLIGWSVELSEYDLKFRPRTTIKGQAVADFLVECISTTKEEKAPEHPVWVLYVDGTASVEGLGAGAVLVGPDGFKFEHVLRFKFQTTNNAVKYEALIYGLKLAAELKVQNIQVFSDSQLVVGQVKGSCETRDPQLGRYASVVNKLKSRFASFQIDKIPRADNQRADELSKLASSQETNPHRSTTVEVLDAPSYTYFTIECQLLSTDPSLLSWTTPLITSMPLLRCLTPYETEYAVREVHEGVCGTHIGGKTLARKLLRHGYYWPTMVEDAQNYVKKYPTCQFNADDIHMPGKMLSSLTSPWPFAQWGVDLLGPFIKGKGGCTFLVVAVDYFTKWIEAKPLSTTTERKIEDFLFNSILCKFGIPKRIIADNGPQFRAAALRSFCNDYGIKLALTSVYTPQSNGQAESANKIVLRGLKARVLAAYSNWVDELNKVLWSCRTTPSSATGETPFSLAYGAEAVIPVEVGLPSDRAGWSDDLNNEQLLRENLDFVEEVRKMSRIRNMAHQSSVAKFYNKRVRAR